MSETGIKTYQDNAGYLKQIAAIEAIQDNYTGHVKDFTYWLKDNQLFIGEDSIRLYISELNKSDNYTAGTKRVKRQAVKRRIRQLYRDSELTEKMKINAFLEDLDSDPDTRAPKINSVQVTRDMFLTYSEVKELIEISRSQRQKLFMRFLFKTGCRVAEMASIKLSDCKFTDSIMKIRVTGKGNKERFIRVDWIFFSAIVEEFKGKKYLFETSKTTTMPGGKPYRPEYISNQIKKQGKRINKNISAHTFRHSFAMEMISRLPAKIDAISRYLGHSDPSITLKMYCHNQIEDTDLMGLDI